MLKINLLQVEDDCWLLKTVNQKSNDDESNEIDSLLAEAAFIMENPDKYLLEVENVETVLA